MLSTSAFTGLAKNALRAVAVVSIVCAGGEAAAVKQVEYPTSIVEVARGETSWTSPGDVDLSDDVRASVLPPALGGESEYLLVTDFGFSIPSGATITGIQVVPEGYYVWNDNRAFVYGFARKSGQTTPAVYTGVTLMATEWQWRLGSQTELWLDTWTPADINSSGFGAYVWVSNEDSYVSNSIYLDSISINVFYTGGAPVIPTLSPTALAALLLALVAAGVVVLERRSASRAIGAVGA